jgi:hypothetical protein
MNEHLSLKIRGQYAALPEDFAIDVEDVNPLFNDYESYTFDAALPIEANRHIFKDMDNIKSDKRLIDIENDTMQIVAEGIPFRTGRLQTSEGENIDGSVSVSMISSTRTIQDMVADLQCRDIPVKDKIQIGEMIGNVRVQVDYKWWFQWKSSGKNGFLSWGSTSQTQTGYNDTLVHTFELQALGFSFPGICYSKDIFDAAEKGSDGKPIVSQSFINVTDEYPIKPYCNGRVCYTHYKKEEDGTSGKTVSTSDEFDPYYILEADRPQSGICFYVLYFLDCLFHYLGFYLDNNKLLSVGDMKRLCFFTTRCKYDLERKFNFKDDDVYDLPTIKEINKWLASRDTGGELKLIAESSKALEQVVFDGVVYKIGDEIGGQKLKKANYKTESVLSAQANIMKMYANSENFPDASVSSILDSLWGSFGIRFVTDYEQKIVRPVFIRDVFRDTSAPIKINARLVNVYKISEKVTGVRMKYSAESDTKDQQNNLRYGVKDYNTDYDYIDYSRVNDDLSYLNIIKKNGCSDTTCYIDLNTGNAYRIKVNKDATKVDELKPAIFEVGGYKGVEIGDCSIANEDFVVEIESGFEPLILNDVNGGKAKNIGDGNNGVIADNNGNEHTVSGENILNAKQILAAFVDEEMWHENMTMNIRNVLGSNYIDAYLIEEVTTNECYDPSNTEDGNSPLQHYDWGTAITIMRGGGSDAQIQQYDYDYDGCGNSKWRIVAAEYSMASDSIDNWGADFDYNGEIEGIGKDERFSLKIRAFKVVDGQILCNDDERDEDGNLIRKVRSRGLFDTFMSEYAQFCLDRKKIGIEFYCTVSDLLNIQWGKRYQIGDLIFWWNKLTYSITAKSGLGLVTAEIYVL